MRRRAYFARLWLLVADTKIRRAVVLLGPRRLGKTVLMHHVIQRLLDDGVEPGSIGYVSVARDD